MKPKNKINKLIFVYNANSGLMNSAFDSMHKIFSPKTYECNLCKLTYGALTVKKDWKDFLETIETPIEFLHKNEFLKKYIETNFKLPAIFEEKENNKVKVFASTNEINSAKNLDELKDLIAEKLMK